MHSFKQTLLFITVTLMLTMLTGCGITAGGLYKHPGYAEIESPYWWQAESEVNLSLGPLLIGTARIVIDEDPTLDALLDDVEGVRVSVYKIKDNSELFKTEIAKTQQNLNADGWHNVMRVSEEENDDYSLMFMKTSGENIEGLVVLTLSDTEATFVNLIGNIRPESFDSIMKQVRKDESTDNSEMTSNADNQK